MLTVDARRLGDIGIVTAAGEVDAHSARILRDALVAAITDGTIRLVADLSEVTFLDSSGLGVLVGKLKDVRVRGGELHVVAVHDRVVRVFAITGLDRVFALHDSLDSALTDLGSPGQV
ncbi:MAG: STAS domain-containing protein [Tetrasphaera sp.]